MPPPRGNDREPELDAVAHDRGDLVLVVGRDHDERVLDPPVGGVGDVRHAREAVELDVVAAGAAREPAHDAPAQCRRVLELGREPLDRRARSLEQERDLRVARLELRAVRRIAQLRGVDGVAVAALVDLAEAVVQRVDQRGAPFRVLEQVVLEVGVPRDDPDVAEHLVEHPRRAAGAALRAQREERLPRFLAEQADDDLAVGERRVVVGDLA